MGKVGANTCLIRGTLCFLSQAGIGTMGKGTITFSGEKVKLSEKTMLFRPPYIFITGEKLNSETSVLQSQILHSS
jgi:hypothetical protein